MRIGNRVIFILCLYIFVVSSARGQGNNATVSGSVVDPVGAAVPDATITAENVRTGIVTTMTTTGSGVYQFPSLVPGIYQISAEKEGFKDWKSIELRHLMSFLQHERARGLANQPKESPRKLSSESVYLEIAALRRQLLDMRQFIRALAVAEPNVEQQE